MSSGCQDDVSFETVYTRYAPQVVGYLKGKGVDDPEAVMQEVFIQLIPRLATAKGGESGVRTLIFSIAHARAVDGLRRRERTGWSVEYDPALDPRSAPSSEDLVAARVADEGALALLAALKPEHQEVLLLRVVADLPIEEVARVMRRSVGSVKQLQRRALLAMTRHLDPLKKASHGQL